MVLSTSGELLVKLFISFLNLQMLRDELSKRSLLFCDAPDRVDNAQAELLDEPVVLVEHLTLKDAETFKGIRTPPHVQPGFVKLQLYTACHQPIGRHLDRHTKIHRQIRFDREAVEFAHPAAIDATGGVARE